MVASFFFFFVLLTSFNENQNFIFGSNVNLTYLNLKIVLLPNTQQPVLTEPRYIAALISVNNLNRQRPVDSVNLSAAEPGYIVAHISVNNPT